MVNRNSLTLDTLPGSLLFWATSQCSHSLPIYLSTVHIDCNNLYDILNKKNIDFLVKNNFISANNNEIKIINDNFNLLN